MVTHKALTRLAGAFSTSGVQAVCARAQGLLLVVDIVPLRLGTGASRQWTACIRLRVTRSEPNTFVTLPVRQTESRPIHRFVADFLRATKSSAYAVVRAFDFAPTLPGRNAGQLTSSIATMPHSIFSGSAWNLSSIALTQFVNWARSPAELSLGGARPSDVTVHPLDVRTTSRSKDLGRFALRDHRLTKTTARGTDDCLASLLELGWAL